MSQDLLKNQENKIEESNYPFAKTQAKLQPKTVSRLQPKLFDLKKSNNTFSNDSSLEKEADEMGKLAAEGKDVIVQDRQFAGLQMKPDDKQVTAEDNVQTRFTEFKITKADLTDAYVIEEFNKMNYTQLFDYKEKAADLDVKSQILELIKAKPKDPNKSYEGKAFTISSDNAVVRNADMSTKKYTKADSIPEGKKEGDTMIIPKGTEVFISEYKSVKKNEGYANIRDYGWTSDSNIEGNVLNETLGIAKAVWDSQESNHKTIGDPDAIAREYKGMQYIERKPLTLVPIGTIITSQETSEDGAFVKVASQNGAILGWIAKTNIKDEKGIKKINNGDCRLRDYGPEYAETKTRIPQGSYIVVKEESSDTNPKGKYVKVSSTKKDGEKYVEDKDLGWTASSNLVGGWADYKGTNAEWADNIYKGQADLVKIVGSESEVEEMGNKGLAKYQEMVAAASADGAKIAVNSGFRDYPAQNVLHKAYQKDPVNNNAANSPGTSHHQIGIAFDLNNRVDATVNIWLNEHAWEYGFIKTYAAANEAHHWEYRPDEIKVAETITKNKKTYRRTYWGTWATAFTDTEIK